MRYIYIYALELQNPRSTKPRSSFFQLSHVLSWSSVPPVSAIAYFSRMYPQHPLTHQYAVRVLTAYPPETLLFYVPQLVQGTRYDKVS